MDGQVFRDQITSFFASRPDTYKYTYHEKNVEIIDGHWSKLGSVLTGFKGFYNILPVKLQKMKFDYNTGGFYKIHRLYQPLNEYTNIIIDIDIYIDKIESAADHKKLKEWHQMALSIEDGTASEEDFNTWQLEFTEDNVRAINGFGKIYRYSVSGEVSRFRLGDPSVKNLGLVYEGTIRQGCAHGFGRTIHSTLFGKDCIYIGSYNMSKSEG